MRREGSKGSAATLQRMKIRLFHSQLDAPQKDVCSPSHSTPPSRRKPARMGRGRKRYFRSQLRAIFQISLAVPGTGRGGTPHRRRWGPEGARLRSSCLLRPIRRALRRGPRPGFSSAAAAAKAMMKKPASRLRLSSGFSVLPGAARTRHGQGARPATAHSPPRLLRRPPSWPNSSRRPSCSARR